MADRSEDLPLDGIRVLVTRAREQSGEVARELITRGAEVTVVPALSTVPIPEPEGFDRAITRIDSYDNIVLTSVNAVTYLLQLLSGFGLGAEEMPPALCIGEKTAGAWEDSGGRVAVVPGQFTARALLDTLEEDLTGRTFLLLRPEVVKTELGREMTGRGAAVDEVIIYRTVAPETGSEELKGLLEDGGPDVIFFASPSAVEGTLKISGRRTQDAGRRILKDIPAVCIGPTTAQAAEEAGFTEVYFPDEHTAEGMVEELTVIAGKIKKDLRSST